MNGADCPPRDDGSDNPAVAKLAVTIIAIVAVWAVATEAMVAAGWLRIPGLAVAAAAVLVASSAVGAAVVFRRTRSLVHALVVTALGLAAAFQVLAAVLSKGQLSP